MQKKMELETYLLGSFSCLDMSQMKIGMGVVKSWQQADRRVGMFSSNRSVNIWWVQDTAAYCVFCQS